jgi:hypothetical protein
MAFNKLTLLKHSVAIKATWQNPFQKAMLQIPESFAIAHLPCQSYPLRTASFWLHSFLLSRNRRPEAAVFFLAIFVLWAKWRSSTGRSSQIWLYDKYEIN